MCNTIIWKLKSVTFCILAFLGEFYLLIKNLIFFKILDIGDHKTTPQKIDRILECIGLSWNYLKHCSTVCQVLSISHIPKANIPAQHSWSGYVSDA